MFPRRRCAFNQQIARSLRPRFTLIPSSPEEVLEGLVAHDAIAARVRARQRVDFQNAIHPVEADAAAGPAQPTGTAVPWQAASCQPIPCRRQTAR